MCGQPNTLFIVRWWDTLLSMGFKYNAFLFHSKQISKRTRRTKERTVKNREKVCCHKKKLRFSNLNIIVISYRWYMIQTKKKRRVRRCAAMPNGNWKWRDLRSHLRLHDKHHAYHYRYYGWHSNEENAFVMMLCVYQRQAEPFLFYCVGILIDVVYCMCACMCIKNRYLKHFTHKMPHHPRRARVFVCIYLFSFR